MPARRGGHAWLVYAGVWLVAYLIAAPFVGYGIGGGAVAVVPALLVQHLVVPWKYRCPSCQGETIDT